MCELYRGRKGGKDGPSLGVVKPRRVVDLVMRAREPWSASQKAKLAQGSLFNTKRALEQPAHAFAYHWFCEDERCNGHTQSIADWELGEMCRRCEREGEDVVANVRAKWLTEICAEDRETMFFVGDQHLHPGAFMVLGTFWPKYRHGAGQLTLDIAA